MMTWTGRHRPGAFRFSDFFRWPEWSGKVLECVQADTRPLKLVSERVACSYFASDPASSVNIDFETFTYSTCAIGCI